MQAEQGRGSDSLGGLPEAGGPEGGLQPTAEIAQVEAEIEGVLLFFDVEAQGALPLEEGKIECVEPLLAERRMEMEGAHKELVAEAEGGDIDGEIQIGEGNGEGWPIRWSGAGVGWLRRRRGGAGRGGGGFRWGTEGMEDSWFEEGEQRTHVELIALEGEGRRLLLLCSAGDGKVGLVEAAEVDIGVLETVERSGVRRGDGAVEPEGKMANGKGLGGKGEGGGNWFR